MGDQDCNFPSPQLSWSMPMAYSSIFSQNQAEGNKFHSTNQKFSGRMFTEIPPITFKSSKVAGIKRSHFSGRTPTILMEKDVASQFDEWGLFSECPLASSLTDDDFLDMVLVKISPLINHFAYVLLISQPCCLIVLGICFIREWCSI